MGMTRCQLNRFDSCGRALAIILDKLHLNDTISDSEEIEILEHIFHVLQQLRKEMEDDRQRVNRKVRQHKHKRKAAERGDNYKLN